MNAKIIGNKVFVNGSPLPPIPGAKSSVNLSQVGNRLYVNGYEYRNGRWKRTLRAIIHALFWGAPKCVNVLCVKTMTPARSKEEESVVSVIISFSVLLLLVGVIIAVPHCMQIAFATKQRLAGRHWSYVKVVVRKCRSLWTQCFFPKMSPM